MADEEKSEVYSKLKDYPQIIKGVEDDSKNLIKTHNEVITDYINNEQII